MREYQKGMVGSDVGGYSNIQSMLRSGSAEYPGSWHSERGAQHIANIQSAFRKSALAEPMTVHRGMVVKGDHPLLTLPVGHTYTDKGVVSTTRDPRMVAKFSKPLNRGDTSVHVEMRLPPGTQALHMKDLGLSDHEKETAIAPNTPLKIVQRRFVGGKHHIVVEAQPRQQEQ